MVRFLHSYTVGVRMKQANRSVIVWSVDPNEDVLKPSGSSLRVLESRNVLPVAVTSPNREVTKKRLREYLKEIGMLTTSFCKVLVSTTYNRTDFVKKLLVYALENQASAIALTSHGRKWLDRLVMGSFAEKMLDLSPLPILFLSDENFKPSRKAMFATDFSNESEVALRNFVRFCDGQISEIIIFHAGYSQVETIAAYSSAGVPAIFPDNFLENREENEIRIKSWAEKYSHNKEGIKIKTMIQDTTQTVSKCILDACKKEEIELIGVSSSLRPWERTVFGSVAQDIFRNGKIPVWIWGEFASEILTEMKETDYEKSDRYFDSRAQNLREREGSSRR